MKPRETPLPIAAARRVRAEAAAPAAPEQAARRDRAVAPRAPPRTPAEAWVRVEPRPVEEARHRGETTTTGARGLGARPTRAARWDRAEFSRAETLRAAPPVPVVAEPARRTLAANPAQAVRPDPEVPERAEVRPRVEAPVDRPRATVAALTFLPPIRLSATTRLARAPTTARPPKAGSLLAAKSVSSMAPTSPGRTSPATLVARPRGA